MPAPAPNTLPLAVALGQSEALSGLLRRMHDSRARLDCIASLVPESMRPGVRPGPLDEAAWVLLVGDSAAAAKLRQLLPAIETALLAAGWPAAAIRIKVLPRG